MRTGEKERLHHDGEERASLLREIARHAAMPTVAQLARVCTARDAYSDKLKADALKLAQEQRQASWAALAALEQVVLDQAHGIKEAHVQRPPNFREADALSLCSVFCRLV